MSDALRTRTVRWILVAWTLSIWGSRVRNIVADDELAGAEQAIAFAVAITLIVSALAVAAAMSTDAPWLRSALAVLVIVGILRWSLRGPVILVSDEWGAGFKAVHTVLWAVTVVLSVGAWREHHRLMLPSERHSAEAQ